ncbi:MAG: hypothetical protein KDB27_03810 [Planctomycetales bacterium]|nr:hypothetical protein [Planctomycetales bacterium]
MVWYESSDPLKAHMEQPSKQTFGLLVAYLIPGALALWGASFFFEPVHWLLSLDKQPTVGGFLYVTLASVGVGMTVSSVRWLVVDRLHSVTGLRNPDWDFSLLTSNVGAYLLLVEFHYRYYQFYANMFIAVAFTHVAWRFSDYSAGTGLIVDFAVVGIECVYFVSSRDSLDKYYERVSELFTKR